MTLVKQELVKDVLIASLTIASIKVIIKGRLGNRKHMLSAMAD